jgi:hypothetical protein
MRSPWDPVSLETSYKNEFPSAMKGNRVFVSVPNPRYNTPDSVRESIPMIRDFLQNRDSVNKITVLFPNQIKGKEMGPFGMDEEFRASEKFIIKYLKENSASDAPSASRIAFSDWAKAAPISAILSCMLFGKYSSAYKQRSEPNEVLFRSPEAR